MRAVAVIPVRMDSSRFPGKPLARRIGRPMVEHTYRRTARCDRLADVYVATCDDEIRTVVEGFGGKVLLTSPSHERATDRVAEAAGGLDADVIVMVQGDEPMVDPRMIVAALDAFEDDSVECVNLIKRIDRDEDYADPNTMKVVRDLRGDALYFSRSPIPARGAAGVPVYKQVCVIPFRREALLEYARLTPTPLEIAESIDMLRLLEHGRRVRLVETDVESHAVDTPADLRLVETLLQGGSPG